MGDSLVTLRITSAKPGPKLDNTYYWFQYNQIQATQGAYSGHLLDGGYTIYAPDGKLMTSGQFKSGVKVGLWKYYDEGNLKKVVDLGREEEVDPNEGFEWFKFRKDSASENTSTGKSLFGRTKEPEMATVEE